MAWKGRTKPPVSFEELQVPLVNSKIQQSNNPLFQTITLLIDKLRTMQQSQTSQLDQIVSQNTIIDNSISTITNNITNIISNVGNATFLTAVNEVANFPSSRRLVAGTNVTFDDTVANVRTINVTGSGSGDVIGPSSSTINDIVTFATTTGKTIKDSGVQISDVVTFIKRAQITINDANIKALPTTPYQLVAAPGIGKRIAIIWADLDLNTLGAAYTNIDDLAWGSFQLGGVDVTNYLMDSSGVVGTRIGDFFGVSQLAQTVMLPLIGLNIANWGAPVTEITGNTALLLNVPLNLFVDNNGAGNFTGGNGANSLIINVLYMIL